MVPCPSPIILSLCDLGEARGFRASRSRGLSMGGPLRIPKATPWYAYPIIPEPIVDFGSGIVLS
eukprot:1914466-Pyramimonas_sp.AAC.1